MRGKKLYMVFLMFTAMMIFAVQSVHATASIPGQWRNVADTLTALQASGSTAVIFDVRAVDEHNGCQPPWAGSDCPDVSGTPPGQYQGVPMWTVDGVRKLPISVPWWTSSTASSSSAPQDVTEVTDIIQGLLEMGVIEFTTEIHTLCRTGVRSHWMVQWLTGRTFTSTRTGSGTFSNLYDINDDADQGGGGMLLWNANSGPRYQDLSIGDDVPPQVFSNRPTDGFTWDSNTLGNDVDFTISILEPTTGNVTGGFSYPTVDRVSLYIDTVETEFSITGTTGSLWTDYPFTTTLADGDYTWTSSAQNSAGTSWSHHALDSGLDVRDLTVEIPTCLDYDGDGYGNPGDASCLNGSATDCDDTDPAINPGAVEGPTGDATCFDTLDNDCDSAIDSVDTGCIPEVISPQDAHDNAAAGIGVIIDVRTVEEHNGCNPAWRAPDTGSGSHCDPINTEDENNGSPQWIDTATGVMSQVPNVPFWISSGATGTLPEDESQFMMSFESLRLAGVIDYGTPIYLICRSGYRSYWAKEYLKTLSPLYTDVHTVDIDADEGNNIGGMLEWYADGLPIHFGEVVADRGFHGPQIYSGDPVDGEIVVSASPPIVPFTGAIFEPSWGRTGFVYADVTRTSLYIDGVEADFSLDDAIGVGTPYTFSAALLYGPHTWNIRTESDSGWAGVQVSWHPHADDAFPGPGDRTIYVTCDMPFSDVSPGHWAEYYINAIACSSISSGCDASNFCPDDFVTRAQMAVFLIRAMGETSSTALYDAYFDDIADDGFALYINRVSELTITSGCGTRLYCPGDPVTRAQMAVFLIRAMGETPSTALYDAYFDDIADDGFAPYINRVSELGITSGCGTRLFCSGDFVTRAQMAVFLSAAFLSFTP